MTTNTFLKDFLEWYHTRICSSDKQSWETVLDAKTISSNLYSVPKKKSNKLDDLIDIDLVKGSTFSKTKSKLNLINLVFDGIVRVLFLPFYLNWWKYQTSRKFSALLLVVYFLQLSNLYIYNKHYFLIQNEKQFISLSEILTPTVIFLILSIVYSYTIGSKKFNRYRVQLIGETAVKDKISCLIWQGNEWHGADLSMLEISQYITNNVEKTPLTIDYFYIGMIFSFLIAFFPIYYKNNEILTSFINNSWKSFDPLGRNYTTATSPTSAAEQQQSPVSQPPVDLNITTVAFTDQLLGLVFGLFSATTDDKMSLSSLTTLSFSSFFTISIIQLEHFYIVVNTFFTTFFLCIMFFTLLSIGERNLVQRFLHAKYFCYLTSNRRARKNNLPHFRLSRVENIKTWLSVRSYIKKKGLQRSIDAIISSTFLIGVALGSIVCIRFLQDADFLSDNLLNWKLVVWCLCIWTFMLRFMTIGFKINKKYRNCMSIVITEQINLYLQIEKKQERKEELTVVNNVLKLASDLLKEIENPFKISGLGINPWVYNVTKVIILSASSAVVSELFGFKLKLYKIKIS